MSKWGNVLTGVRLAFAALVLKGVKVKGVPVQLIADAVEQGIGTVQKIKAAKPKQPKPPAGSTGE